MTRLRTVFPVVVLAAAGAAAPSCELVTEGRPLMRLTGQVTDVESGAPVDGALIRLAPRSRTRPSEVVAETFSDVDGFYEILVAPAPGYARVDCSSIEISVYASGYQLQEGVLSWYVERCLGERATADIGLVPGG